MSRVLSFVSALSLATCAFALAQTNSITFVGHPKDTGMTCNGTAEAVGSFFAKAAKVELVSAKCLRDRWLSYDLQVVYSSEVPLPLVVSPEWPVYRTKAACDAALIKEEKFFVDTTGLSPFMRYCSDFGEASSWEKSIIHLYTPFFYAVGKPKRIVKTLSLEMYPGGYYGGATPLEEILEKSRLAGLPIVQAYIDAPPETKNFQSFLRMRFADNADKPISLLSREYLLKDRIEGFWISLPWELDLDPMLFESLTACEAQKSTVEPLFLERFTNPVVWFCMWDHSLFRARLHHLRIRPGEENFQRLTPGEDGEPFSNEYASFEACEKDKPRIVTHYRAKLGESVVGALCSSRFRANPSLPSKAYVYWQK